jgi:hypothetical protein
VSGHESGLEVLNVGDHEIVSIEMDELVIGDPCLLQDIADLSFTIQKQRSSL